MLYIPKQFQNLVFDRAKAMGLSDRKQVHIALILTYLQSLNPVNFRAGQKPNFEIAWVYNQTQELALDLSVSTLVQ